MNGVTHIFRLFLGLNPVEGQVLEQRYTISFSENCGVP